MARPGSIVGKGGNQGPARVAEAKGGKGQAGQAQSRLRREARCF